MMSYLLVCWASSYILILLYEFIIYDYKFSFHNSYKCGPRRSLYNMFYNVNLNKTSSSNFKWLELLICKRVTLLFSGTSMLFGFQKKKIAMTGQLNFLLIQLALYISLHIISFVPPRSTFNRFHILCSKSEYNG